MVVDVAFALFSSWQRRDGEPTDPTANQPARPPSRSRSPAETFRSRHSSRPLSRSRSRSPKRRRRDSTATGDRGSSYRTHDRHDRRSRSPASSHRSRASRGRRRDRSLSSMSTSTRSRSRTRSMSMSPAESTKPVHRLTGPVPAPETPTPATVEPSSEAKRAPAGDGLPRKQNGKTDQTNGHPVEVRVSSLLRVFHLAKRCRILCRLLHLIRHPPRYRPLRHNHLPLPKPHNLQSHPRPPDRPSPLLLQ